MFKLFEGGSYFPSTNLYKNGCFASNTLLALTVNPIKSSRSLVISAITVLLLLMSSAKSAATPDFTYYQSSCPPSSFLVFSKRKSSAGRAHPSPVADPPTALHVKGTLGHADRLLLCSQSQSGFPAALCRRSSFLPSPQLPLFGCDVCGSIQSAVLPASPVRWQMQGLSPDR